MIGFETQDIYIYIYYIYTLFLQFHTIKHTFSFVCHCVLSQMQVHTQVQEHVMSNIIFLNTTKSILNCTCLGFSPRIIVAFVVAPVIGDQYVASSCSGVAIGPMQDQFTQC